MEVFIRRPFFELNSSKLLLSKRTRHELEEEFFRAVYPFSATNVIRLQLLEIKNIDNPSSCSIRILKEGEKDLVIPLYKHRSKFLHQNGVFILDLAELPGLELDVRNYRMFLNFEDNTVEEEWSLKIYGEFIALK